MAPVSPEPLIRGDGTSEAAWQPWLDSETGGAAAACAWLPPRARLVVVAPHPDDEVLACGATLAMHAAHGGECLVIAVTDGEASHPGASPAIARALACCRRQERDEGLSRLGVRSATSVVRLGLPDGRVGDHRATLSKLLSPWLRPTDVVLTTWRHDGHPDHDATGRAAVSACTAAACRLVEVPVWMWHWARPGDLRVPWHRLKAVRLAPDARARKQHALHAHASQLQPRAGNAGPVLGSQIVKRAGRALEHFLV
jgi:LmbE family N-acetylglucosaminyl deacetylase